MIVALVPFLAGPTDGAHAAATARTLFVGVNAGSSSVTAFDAASSTPVAGGTWQAYTGFSGGSRVAVGDVNGDGIPDVITAPGTGGGAIVKVFDGATVGSTSPTQLRSFVAFTGFTGAVSVAAGDVDGDGLADIIAATDAGGSHVKVFSGQNNAEIRSFIAFPGFTGGVRVAAGDIDGDGLADIVVGTGTATAHVKVFSGQSNAEIRSFFAFSGFTGEVVVASGDIDGDGLADIVVGTGTATAHVKVFSGQSNAEIRSFIAFSGFTGGVTVATGDVDGDGRADLVVGTGPGTAHVKVFSGQTGSALIRSFIAFSGSTAGVFVAGAPVQIATQLEFSVQPGGAHVNQPLSPQPVVRALNASGILVPSFTGPVTLSFENGATGAALNGTTTVAAINGVTTFTNVSISTVFSAYRLRASASSLSPAISTTFAITAPPPPDVATQLVFTGQPGGAVALQPFTQQPSLVALKANGQIDTTFTGPVTLSIGSNPSGGALSGTLTVNASGGTATFNGLSIDKPGAGFTLVGHSGSLQAATSNALNVAAQVVCTPRPPIVVTVIADSGGRLKVTIQAPQGAGYESNRLSRIQFSAADNGLIDLPANSGTSGQPSRAGLTGSAGGVTVTLTEQPATLTFWVRRSTAGRATTSQFIVTDACGDWKTFAGGGPNAF